MVISVHARRQSDVDVEKMKSLTETEFHDDESPDLRMHLSEVLQSSLELNTLLTLFLESINTAVRLDGIYYCNEDQGINATIAKQATHSCGYRLITTEDRLGEIVFKRSKKFNEKEQGILESLLSPLIHPLRNSLKYTRAVNAAFKDPLTGVNNIATLDTNLEREIGLAKRHNSGLSAVMIDVDHMKRFNNKFGHGRGDAVLAALARNISQLVRCTDSVYRYEDDQFLVILNNTQREGALIIAARIHECVKNLRLYEGDGLPTAAAPQLTLSLGIAVLTGTDSSNSLLERTNKALLAAKSLGGNTVQS